MSDDISLKGRRLLTKQWSEFHSDVTSGSALGSVFLSVACVPPAPADLKCLLKMPIPGPEPGPTKS